MEGAQKVLKKVFIMLKNDGLELDFNPFPTKYTDFLPFNPALHFLLSGRFLRKSGERKGAEWNSESSWRAKQILREQILPYPDKLTLL